MENILVIHPLDPTTDFLCQIYRDINATVIREQVSKSHLKTLIKDSDRVIIMGHGTEKGMGSVSYRNGYDVDINFIIDSNLIYLLREKKDNVYIWCHADLFVKKYDLKGFSTGMFISEKDEADFFNVNSTAEEINQSNNKFAEIVKNSIKKDGESIRKSLLNEYTFNSEVCKYNLERIFNFQ